MKEGDSDLSEREIIERGRSLFRRVPQGWIGIGDDAALIGNGESILLTGDVLNEGVHFKPDYFPPYYLGWKLIAINVSDIVSKGGKPVGGIVFLNLKSSEKNWVEELFRGIRDAGRCFGVRIIGGNTSRAPSISLGCAMVGKPGKSNFITRKGGREGDFVYLWGTPGLSFTGMNLLKKFGFKEALKRWKRAVLAHLQPRPPVKKIEEIVKKFSPTSMTDTSDSLYESLHNILPPGCDILIYNLPVHKGIPMEHALFGGEDYNLLFTSPFRICGLPPLEIGKVVKGSGKVKIEMVEEERLLSWKKKYLFSHF